MMILFVLLMTNRKMEMKAIFNDYQFAKSSWGKELHVDRGRKIMRTSLLPYVLEIYGSGDDIEFAEAMVNACDSKEATDLLWKIAEDPKTKPLIRTICLAHLLNRHQLWVWSEITEQDIDTIATSMPAHVVHWKTLLLRDTGQPRSVFKNDPYPERYKFKALFRQCIETYTLKEQQRKRLRQQTRSAKRFPSMARAKPAIFSPLKT